jgi:hypothetical protein
MESEVFEMVRKNIVDAEWEYVQAKADIRGIKAVAKAIEKMRQVRGTVVADGIDRLIASSESKYSNALGSLGPAASPSQPVLDFKEWAHELQCAVKLHDPLLLSLDFSDAGEGALNDELVASQDTPKSWRSVTPSSKVLLKMTPMGKHCDETFAYLEGSSKGTVRQFHAIAFCAWAFAVICMVLALGFLTKEFVKSQKNPAIRIKQVPSTELELPALSMCSSVEGLPSFHDYPKDGYPGHPLFAVSVLQNLHDSDVATIRYPSTTSSGFIEETYLGADVAKCKKDTSMMSTSRARQALFRYSLERNISVIDVKTLDEAPCLKCFRVGATRRQRVSADKPRSPVEMPVTVSVSASRAFSACQIAVDTRPTVIYNFFPEQLISHTLELETRGIVSFPKGLTQRGRVDAYSPSGQMDANAYKEMYCSVYFFSGYFYPSEDAGKVSFEWSPESKTWKSIGSAKYSPYTHERSAPYTFGPGSDTAHKDVYFGRGIEVHYEDPQMAVKQGAQVSPDSFASSLLGSSHTLAYLTRTHKSDGSIHFEADADEQLLDSLDVNGDRYIRWNVGFDYRDFATTTISVQPTLSWPEFVTDVFEFVGLFTGVCIFSMIVAPSQALV